MPWSGVASTAIKLTCTAVLLEVVGFSTPFWIHLSQTSTDTVTEDETTTSKRISIWYMVTCVSGKSTSCEFTVRTPSSNDFEILASSSNSGEKIWMTQLVVSTVGLGLSCLALLTLIYCRCCGVHSQCLFTTTSVLLFLGDTLVLGLIAWEAKLYAELESLMPGFITLENFPYSALVFGIGGLIGVLAAIFLFMVTCSWQKYGAYLPVPVSHKNRMV